MFVLIFFVSISIVLGTVGDVENDADDNKIMNRWTDFEWILNLQESNN